MRDRATRTVGSAKPTTEAAAASSRGDRLVTSAPSSRVSRADRVVTGLRTGGAGGIVPTCYEISTIVESLL
jgi:hypothetical protein